MRFAYLIMAHDNPEQLLNLIHLLDWPENDIFLHIDKKSSELIGEISSKCAARANLSVYSNFKVYWGDISQTKCQIFLLEEAVKSYHDYYHLLSGHDLPLKTHSEILKFFSDNKGKEFVHFMSNNYCMKQSCAYYHILWPIISRIKNYRVTSRFLGLLENLLLVLQKRLGISRHLYSGANWFSITHELAKNFIADKDRALSAVRWTVSSDEHILQTWLRMFSQKQYDIYCTAENDYRSIMRVIDWNRGGPYVWKIGDIDELKNSDRLFARKFDEKIDKEIIDELTIYLKTENKLNDLKNA